MGFLDRDLGVLDRDCQELRPRLDLRASSVTTICSGEKRGHETRFGFHETFNAFIRVTTSCQRDSILGAMLDTEVARVSDAEYVALKGAAGSSVAMSHSDRSTCGLSVLTFLVSATAGLAVGLMCARTSTGVSTNVLTIKPSMAPDTYYAGTDAHKFGVDAVTPVALQMARGTCWIFAATAVLEHSYRKQGIAMGYLQPDSYVRLSQQVFGIAVLDACAALSNESCLIGDEVWVGNQLRPVDTQGGDANMLYWLKRLETRSALPHSVCPYTETTGYDRECPGMQAALAQSPLSFETRSMRKLYHRNEIKTALRRDRRVMSLSTGMVTIVYLLPCTEATASILQCDPNDRAACVACPLEPVFGGVSCCVASERESNTMGGEFFRLPPISHPSPKFEGGHAMALVGYSDGFRTVHGFTGGYILKNSWWDGLPPSEDWKHARGSHSLEWFLQTISRQDEALSCPNSHAPTSWFECADLFDCRRRQTSVFAKAMRQPLHLICTDQSPYLRGICEEGESYFLQSLTSWGAGLSVGCFLHDAGDAPPSAGQGRGVVTQAMGGAGDAGDAAGDVAADAAGSASPRVVCSPPVPLDDLALLFSPVVDERLPNDPDICGFYFLPYELVEAIVTMHTRAMQSLIIDCTLQTQPSLARPTALPLGGNLRPLLSLSPLYLHSAVLLPLLPPRSSSILTGLLLHSFRTHPSYHSPRRAP